MESRTLEINVASAKDLNNVNLITKMDVYVVVSISGGDQNSKHRTTVDRAGNTNPTWNFPITFTVDEAAAQQNRLTLVFKLRCERSLGDKDVGEVHVPVKELLDGDGDSATRFVSYQVRKPSGKPKGQLTFSYKFGPRVGAPAPEKVSGEPVTAYPMVGPSSAYPPQPTYMAAGGPYPPPPGGYPSAPPMAGGYGGYPPPPQYGGYPPPPPQPGYGYPGQPGYGYPGQPGYRYPPGQQQQPPKKNKFGMGLGAGLLGGALGGLLIGDMILDGGDCDPGFGDFGF